MRVTRYDMFEASYEYTILGLSHIHNFGWLRAPELGRLLWPHAKHSQKYGERWARMAIESQIVIPRKLPGKAGTALVLSKRGADLLLDFGVRSAKSNKDWGESEHGEWYVPRWWRHDLLSAGVLSLLVGAGFSILPERQIRRQNPGLQKYPDGLAYKSKDGLSYCYWLEVESARKSGKSMTLMAANLVDVALGAAPTLSRVTPNRGLVALCKDAADERGYQLNHATRVKNAVYRQLGEHEVELDFLHLYKKGAGVVDFDHEIVTFSPQDKLSN